MADWMTILVIVSIALNIFMLAISIYQLVRRKKSLAYREVSEIPLPERDVGIRNIHLLRMTFMNDGKEDISEKDFIEPITLVFNPQAKVWCASAKDRIPKHIQIPFEYQKGSNTVGVRANLLKPKEWFTTDFIVEEYENYDITARIVDVKKLREYKRLTPPNILSGYFFIFLYICILAYDMITEQMKLTSLLVLSIFVLIIGELIFLIILYPTKRSLGKATKKFTENEIQEAIIQLRNEGIIKPLRSDNSA